ncbi:MAG: hypothetical protein DMG54_34545 [Acidobacteria bacterium]|nr:MAG: hypothetical protein DMG54_34545 [Acidobacteriota bacterium]PYU51185.1 MAG: hypothetical protein DMG53_01970 [Acidobacteriota bacterium]PYU77430.1 MAG: hypothetical protein DMG52_00435 [Acidobacteriota bacterium]
MTTAQAVGAVSREAAEWHAIDWRAINRNVRRLQVRIVQATKERRVARMGIPKVATSRDSALHIR